MRARVCLSALFALIAGSRLCGVIFPRAAGSAAQDVSDTAAVARAIQERYNSIRSFRAQFVQIYRSAFSEDQESGTLYMKKPGKMRWEYTSPAVKLFVTDGLKGYFYVPKDKQVFVSDWRTDSASLPLLFLVGEGNLTRDFDISVSLSEPARAGGNLVLRLSPRKENAAFKEILLEVQQPGATIVRLAVIEHSGNRNDYLLRSFQENVPVPDERFRFKIPKGVEVIE